jgi:hypothetical protein
VKLTLCLAAAICVAAFGGGAWAVAALIALGVLALIVGEWANG